MVCVSVIFERSLKPLYALFVGQGNQPLVRGRPFRIGPGCVEMTGGPMKDQPITLTMSVRAH